MELKTSQPGLAERVKNAFRRDRKWSILLIGVIVIGALAAVRALSEGSVPSGAKAAIAVAASANREIARSESPQAAAEGESASEDNRRQEYIRKVDRTITRDLFAVNLDLFPPAEASRKILTEAQSRPAASDPVQLQHQAILAESRALSLQSTMVGDNPTAIVNGKVLKVGSRIGDFEVVEITDHLCVVRKQDVTVNLTMKRDD